MLWCSRNSRVLEKTYRLLLIGAADWKAEIQKFAPSLSAFYAHPAETTAEELAEVGKPTAQKLAGKDLARAAFASLDLLVMSTEPSGSRLFASRWIRFCQETAGRTGAIQWFELA